MNGNEKASGSERAAGGGPQPDEAPRPAPAELQPERDQLADEAGAGRGARGRLPSSFSAW